jgi:hypothetical protein
VVVDLHPGHESGTRGSVSARESEVEVPARSCSAPDRDDKIPIAPCSTPT